MAIVIGVAILLYSHWARLQVEGEVESLFRAHVDSVALLVEEGAREAAASTSLIYELTEEHLSTAAELLPIAREAGQKQSNRPVDEAWTVHLVFSDDAPPQGEWGPVPEDERTRFLDQLDGAGPDELVDTGLAADLGLLCLYRKTGAGLSLVCQSAEKVNALRAKTGIGPLLRGVVKEDVRFVALQDATGVLAIAPSTDLLTKWGEDPMLEASLIGESDGTLSRLRQVNGQPVFEGLIPFEMADESKVVLRIGIDASPLLEVRENLEQRYNVMVALAAGVVLLVGLLSWFFWRWQEKEAAMQALLASQAEQQKHWQTIGQMAATVAHEVRNPLNTVAMVSQRLQTEFSIDGEERADFDEMVGLLLSESKRVGQVIQEFLDLGAPLKLQLEQIDVEDSLNTALLPMQIRAEKEGKTIALIHRGGGRVVLDDMRFRQMVTNLVGNALDAVSEGGEVVVRSECSPTGLQLKVVDNGMGLNEDEVKNVIHPFVSLKASGTGLGLPLVKRFTDLHGGEFTIESKRGKGTTARIVIPAPTGSR
jgi:signal transduction histidine kinase